MCLKLQCPPEGGLYKSAQKSRCHTDSEPRLSMTDQIVSTELRTLPGACVRWRLWRRRRWFVHCRGSRWRALLLDFFFLWFFLFSTACIPVAHDLLPFVLRYGRPGHLRLHPPPSVS